jgi:hypothetical protein
MTLKNNHAVRRYGFHYCYEPQDERAISAALWEVLCLKLHFFTAIKKPTGWSKTPLANAHGSMTSLKPRTTGYVTPECYPKPELMNSARAIKASVKLEVTSPRLAGRVGCWPYRRGCDS